MQQGNDIECCFMWLLRESETMMKHICQLGNKLLQSANLLGSSICMPSLDVTSDCTVAYSAIVLASCLGHRCHATPSHQSYLNRTGTTQFRCCLTSIQVLSRSSQYWISTSNCLRDWVTRVASALYTHSYMSTRKSSS